MGTAPAARYALARLIATWSTQESPKTNFVMNIQARRAKLRRAATFLCIPLENAQCRVECTVICPLACPIICCAGLSRLLNLSVPQFLYLQSRDHKPIFLEWSLSSTNNNNYDDFVRHQAEKQSAKRELATQNLCSLRQWFQAGTQIPQPWSPHLKSTRSSGSYRTWL